MPEAPAIEFPSSVAEFLRELPLAPLGPGRPQLGYEARLQALDDAALGRIVDRPLAACCRAALWLAFDFLDQSHEISQGVDTVEGSYWHAIMHRREPDNTNAAYWLRKVGQHAIHTDLVRVAAELGYTGKGSGWDAFAFNDACERHRDKGDAAEELLRKVQRAEWQALFAWCFSHATGQAEGK